MNWKYEIVGTKEAVAEAIKHIPEVNPHVPEFMRKILADISREYFRNMLNSSVDGAIIKTSGKQFNSFDEGEFTLEIRMAPIVK